MINKFFSLSQPSNLIRDEGLIKTTSVDPNYIIDVIRRVPGEVSLSSDNRDRVELDNLYVIPDGGYFEIGADSDQHETNMHFMHNKLNNCRFGQGNATARLYSTTNQQRTWSINNDRIYYVWRIERTGNSYELYRDGVSLGSKSFSSGEIAFDIIGNKDVGDYLYEGSVSYVDFNGVRFDFNEVGNNPEVYSNPL